MVLIRILLGTRRVILHTGLLALSTFCLTTLGLAQENDNRSYILLDHGGILHGIARPVGEKIEIQLGLGNTVLIDSKDIAHMSPTKQGLYDYQIRSIRRWDANEHWHLTKWCIQNELIDQALFHFKELEKLEEPSPRLKQLEHQVKIAILRSEPVRRYLAEKQLQSPENPSSHQSEATEDDKIQLASANVPITPFLDSSNEKKVSQIPSYVRKAFQQSISPILVSKCGQAGCHGLPGKSTFHIYQPVGEQASETSIRNLTSVLKYVNTKKPGDSSLLAYATNPHGIQRYPALNPLKESDHTALSRVEQWIRSIDAVQSSEVTSAVAKVTSHETSQRQTSSMPTLLEVPGGSTELPRPLTRKEKLLSLRNDLSEHDPNAKLSKPAKTGFGPVQLDDSEILNLERAIERLEKQQAAKGQKDPFDPNEFNTRFGSKK